MSIGAIYQHLERRLISGRRVSSAFFNPFSKLSVMQRIKRVDKGIWIRIC